MTIYIVLRAKQGTPAEPVHYWPVGTIEANNSAQAVRRTVESMTDGFGPEGVTHIAVPMRNWRAGEHTFRAEVQRKLLPVTT